MVCGSVGENTSLTTEEKLQIIEVAKDAAGGKIPVIAGVAEFTTAFAQKMAKEAERVGVDGIMVMPALVYLEAARNRRPLPQRGHRHRPADYGL